MNERTSGGGTPPSQPAGRRRSALLIAVFAALPLFAQVASEAAKLPGPVSIAQKLNTRIPLDLMFRDEAGKVVRLHEYFNHGRPVILNFVYYRCPMLCPMVLEGTTTAEHLRRRQAVDVEVPAPRRPARDQRAARAGRPPVKLIMTSEDVIHSFFVPAFRVKADVIPGRYTQHLVQATKPGTLSPVLRRVLRHEALGMIGRSS
jgi:hypothetical protein